MKVFKPLKPLQSSILAVGLAAATFAAAQTEQKSSQNVDPSQKATTPVVPSPKKKQKSAGPAATRKAAGGQTNPQGTGDQPTNHQPTGETAVTAVTNEAASGAASPAPAAPAMSEAEALPQGTPFVADLNLFGPSTAELRQRLNNALRNDPALSGSNIVANVSDDTISLTGSVRTAKDRQTAHRIAESFATNRKVKEKITVAGSAAKSDLGQSASDVKAPKNQSAPQSSPTTQKPESPNRTVLDPANAQEKPKAGE